MNSIRNYLILLGAIAVIFANAQVSPTKTEQPSIGVAWGFAYGHEGGDLPVFMPTLHEMGVHLTKLYLFWQQVEPVENQYDWTAVDMILSQLDERDEALIAVWSASNWATRVSTSMLPPSPANDLDAYYQFVFNLVTRCNGRIKYWQNDCEPNNPVYWNGSADEFIVQLKVFYQAVKDADPNAQVVVGGYDGLFNPPGMREYPGQVESLAFFDHVIQNGSAYFDIFDLRLYGDPYTIPARVSYFQERLENMGKKQPIICTEYNGPGFYAFPENRKYINLAMQWQRSIANLDTTAYEEITNPIKSLYDSIATLAPATQMFLMGCDSSLENKYYRIQCRDIVQRNLLAFSAGVGQTHYWDLWHNTDDTLNLMTLMYGKNKLMDYHYRDGQFRRINPMPAVIARLAEHLGPFTGVQQIDLEDPTIFFFLIEYEAARPRYVIWERRDAFSGEDHPKRSVTIPWAHVTSQAMDVFGKILETKRSAAGLTLTLAADPVFIRLE